MGGGDEDDGGGSRPDSSAATMQAFLGEGGRTTEDGVAEQIPPNQEEAKEPENGDGTNGVDGVGDFINQGKKTKASIHTQFL